MKRVHFIGVCGTAMATLAAMLKARGFDVQGSDHGIYPPMSEFLAREQIRTFDGYDAANITGDIDLVVIGNAVSRGNPELETVLDRKVRYCSLPEAIRDQFLWDRHSIVIAGTHGKTTTTSMAAWLLTTAGEDPSLLVGGIASNFDGSFRLGSGRDFVIEGDEYDSAFFDKTAKFLKYLPDIAVIGNIEYDHADIYPDMEALRVAFRRLINLIPRNGLLLLGADCPECQKLAVVSRSPVETFGFSEGADWRAAAMESDGSLTRFLVTYRTERLGHFEVPLSGAHNVRNALAALAVGKAAGVSPDRMREGLKGFQGVRRRLEKRGEARGVAVFDDFAHHPTAILETIRAVKLSYPNRRVWAVFEPRSATACRKIFQDDFIRAFHESGADQVVLAAVFRASLPEAERLSVAAIVEELKKRGVGARTLPGADEIVEAIAAEATDGDIVVIMSNGGFDDIHTKLLTALGR
ncbi:MAG: UDP-N-acetylmuramate:L-alanyl-gamma-D-glutamyl-meso-diaminopimelate ligase [Vicinamibacterales bacterium]